MTLLCNVGMGSLVQVTEAKSAPLLTTHTLYAINPRIVHPSVKWMTASGSPEVRATDTPTLHRPASLRSRRALCGLSLPGGVTCCRKRSVSRVPSFWGPFSRLVGLGCLNAGPVGLCSLAIAMFHDPLSFHGPYSYEYNTPWTSPPHIFVHLFTVLLSLLFGFQSSY